MNSCNLECVAGSEAVWHLTERGTLPRAPLEHRTAGTKMISRSSYASPPCRRCPSTNQTSRPRRTGSPSGCAPPASRYGPVPCRTVISETRSLRLPVLCRLFPPYETHGSPGLYMDDPTAGELPRLAMPAWCRAAESSVYGYRTCTTACSIAGCGRSTLGTSRPMWGQCSGVHFYVGPSLPTLPSLPSNDR
jgi:hypothetical protein